MPQTVSVTETIHAPRETLWAMVSDVTRMGEWSPENTGATWLKGATGPSLGAAFKGTNRLGKKSWTTKCTITVFDAPAVFSFMVTSTGQPVAEWTYRFDETEGGCAVTETWTDRRNAIVRLFGKPVSGVDHDDEYTRKGIAETLARLKAAAEAR